MLGFDLDIWDYLTFLALMVSVLGGLAGVVWLAGLDQSRFPIGAGGEAAIYTKGMTGSWAALRRIGIRTTSWSNFLYPMPF